MPPIIAYASQPTVLLGSLEGVKRKVRVLSVLYGAGIVLASAVILLLAVVGLDYLLNLPAVPRLIVMILAIGVLGCALYRWIALPLMARLNIRDVAGRLETAFPQFNDRLRSTVDFLGGQVPGSEFMKQRVVGEASELASSVNLSRAIVARPVLYSLSSGV